jgi:hypothetical protein
VRVAGLGEPAAVDPVAPLEYSLGTSPQNPMNWLAWPNRRQSATSAANVSAPSRVMPR